MGNTISRINFVFDFEPQVAFLSFKRTVKSGSITVSKKQKTKNKTKREESVNEWNIHRQ
jgi:hypothetical protein